jgi:dihydrofolate reductase
MSVDGFIAGPDGEMNWMTLPWTDDLNTYVSKLVEPVDTIVLGRKLAEGFIPYWTEVAADVDNPEYQGGRKFTDTPKVVFTQTMEEPAWDNTELARGNLTEEISRLKKQDGNAIYACGGATFVSALIQQGLVDEYHLFVNPVALGNGLPIFRELDRPQSLSLVKSIAFDCGIVLLHYEPERL